MLPLVRTASAHDQAGPQPLPLPPLSGVPTAEAAGRGKMQMTGLQRLLCPLELAFWAGVSLLEVMGRAPL